ncbi:HPF/RaiA family ribosome-associated protein [Flavihumibacter stibioxidans]|uniref:Sigma-54 modulation protein n=1 Tax=Flavihumibacter stibioxidans TaxID=1834163 RepID=A0ABR7M533_9BACT|nr:HPF/RaiA family ribosome-associated protein [Flavihumibacter stibioxidans]MBC6490114.1 hypothetical protein [Flavihumibacter stibioxidans]
MTIEINCPHLKIEESFLKSMEKELLELSHLNKDISRAEVFFREDESQPADNKICEIRLTVFSDNLYARRVSENFYLSAREVMDELKTRVLRQVELGKEPPEETTSTVDV